MLIEFRDIFGKLITTNAQLLEVVANMVGPELAESAKLPPTPLLFIPIGIVGAISAGFTINMIFALLRCFLIPGDKNEAVPPPGVLLKL